MKERKLEYFEYKINELEERLNKKDWKDKVVYIILGILLLAFILFLVIPNGIQWYNTLSEFDKGQVSGVFAGIMLTLWLIFVVCLIYYNLVME
jgi:polyferredoxin